MINISGEKKLLVDCARKALLVLTEQNETYNFNTQSSLAEAHNTNTEVRVAYLLDEVEKMVEGTPHQRILKYAKAQAKYEGQLDFYIILAKNY